MDLFKQLTTTQNPETLFITCSDSSVIPELLTQQALYLQGWVYDIGTGSIVALDGRTHIFVPWTEFPDTTA